MNATTIEADDGLDLKGMEFSEACAALANIKTAKGYVHKKADSTSRWAFCFSFTPNEYGESELLELIGAEYGAGEYPVQFKTRNKKGNELIRWQKNIHVQARRLGAQVTAPPAAPAAAPGPSDMLAAAIESQTQMLSAVLDKLATPAPVPEQKDTLEIAKDLAALKDLFTDSKQSVLEQVKDVLELKQMLLDNGDAPSDPIAAALKYLGPAIEKGIEAGAEAETARAAPPAAPAPRKAEPGAPRKAEPGAPGPTVEAETEQPMSYGERGISDAEMTDAFQFFTTSYLPAALTLAARKEAPQHVAEYLARVIGTNWQAKNAAGLVLSQDNMVERFAAFDERVMQHAPWFDLVGDWLAHMLWPEMNAEPKIGHATVDATVDATIDETAADGAISDAEPTGAADNELVAGGEALPDEQRPDLPPKGNGNNA